MTDHLLYSEDFTGEIRTFVKPDGVPIPEITTVGGWTPFWREDDFCLRPEMHVIDASNPNYLEPVMRVNDAGRGLKIFKQWALIDAGYRKQYVIPDGYDSVWVRMRGHCWYSQRDNAELSEYKDDNDEWQLVTSGMLLEVELETTGGSVARSTSSENIYDGHAWLQTIPHDDPDPLITVSVGAFSADPFKHCDAYVCEVEVWGGIDSDPLPTPEPEPEAHVDYVVVVNLLPQDATKTEKAYVLDLVHESRETILQSADDAARLVVPGIDESRVKAWDAHRWPDDEYALEDWLKTRGVGLVEYWYLPGDEPSPDPQPVPDPDPPPDPEADPPLDPEPDLPPDPTWSPHNYVPTGTKLGFHAAGDGGQTGDVFAPLTPLGAQPPTSKVIVSLGAARDIKAIDPSVKTIGRIIDAPGYGNVEGFDYGGDPEGQAHWHMAAIMQAFGPHLEWYDYIEVINEQGPPSPAYHVKLAQFFLHCMTIANTWGMKLALFSHSTGIPEPEDWDAIADTGIFEAVAQWGHCISLHEYNLNGIGGCLYRYRDLYERIILPKQLDIPLYITEYNVDVADAGNADVMFANWTAYDAELARDPYVAGVHIYSTGEVYSSYRPTIYSLWDRYRAYAISVKDRVNG